MQKNVGLFSGNSLARQRCIYKKYLWDKGCMFITNWVQRTRKMSNKLRFTISDPEDDFELVYITSFDLTTSHTLPHLNAKLYFTKK